MTELRAVRQHSALQIRGGAVHVARLLHERLPGLGLPSELAFETAEEPDARVTPAREAGRNLSPDTLLHLHTTRDWPALLAALPAALPLVLTLHDAGLLTGGCAYPLDCPGLLEGCLDPCPLGCPRARERQAAQREALSHLKPRLAAPSSWLARLARAALPGLPVTVIPNGVPWPGRPPSRTRAREALGIAPQARVVVFAAHGGADAGYKSGPRWAEYWQGLKQRVPGALGFAAGGWETRRDGDFVTWPYLDREHLNLLFAAADLLFYPTLADNHPLVVLEAMSQATACAAFAVGGLPEQIEDGVNGLLAPPGQDQALLDAAAALLASPSRSRDMGELAFSRGAARFAVERMAGDYLRFYRS